MGTTSLGHVPDLEYRALEMLRDHAPLSRSDVARRLQISKPTASDTIEGLLQKDLVYELGYGQSAGGRRPMLLDLNARASFVVGIDLGGSNVRVNLADFRGQSIATARERTLKTSAKELSGQLARLVDQLAAENRIARSKLEQACLASPGVWDKNAGIVRFSPNLPVLEDRAFATELEQQLDMPVGFENDVNAAVLGEHRFGTYPAAATMVFLAMGTGLGAGILLGGNAFAGPHHRAGEVGYFKRGSSTLEDILTGSGLAKAHEQAGGGGTSEGAITEALAGREPGRSVVHRFLQTLASTISGIALLLDPDHVVLGGGLGIALGPLLHDLELLLSDLHPFPVNLHITALGDDAALIGATVQARDSRWLRLRSAQR